MVFAVIINGLSISESIESRELNEENTEQTTELTREESAVFERKVAVRKSTFVAGFLPNQGVNPVSKFAYLSIPSSKNSRPILHRSLRI